MRESANSLNGKKFHGQLALERSSQRINVPKQPLKDRSTKNRNSKFEVMLKIPLVII